MRGIRFRIRSSAAPESRAPSRLPFSPGLRILIALGCLVFLLLTLRPVYRQIKEWRAYWLAEQAEDLVKEQKWVEALQKASAAYQLSPGKPFVILAMARSYGPVNQDYALSLWAYLQEKGLLDRETATEYIRYCLDVRRPDLAYRELALLLQKNPGDEVLLLLAARAAALNGEWAKAAAYCRSVVQKNPRQREGRFMLAGFLYSFGQPGDKAEARRLLEQLQDEKDDFSLQALIQLSRWPDLSSADLEKLRYQIRSHPQAGEKEKLLADELRLRANPAERFRILAETQDFYRQKKPGERLEAARWFNRQKEPDRVLELIPLQDALSRQDLFLVWADAMALDGRWRELDDVLARETVPMEGLLVTIFRARSARELGDANRSVLLWNQALNDSSTRPEMLWYMASYAEKLELYDLAQSAYLRLTRITAVEKNAYVALVGMLQKQGDTRALRDVMKLMTERFPHEATAVNDLAYLNLLLGENEDEARKSAQSLVAGDPGMMAYRVTAALGSLKKSAEDEAYAYYASAHLADISVLKPSWQAVYVAIQGARGKKEEARALAETLTNRKLLPEERALIQPYL